MNRLADSHSPYLLQHQHNPVEWFPWCDEAFEQAVRTDRPLFLSVGYAACHWCHVMERESFENLSIAKFLNEHFVAIKVDREERPDIDQIYMNAVQIMTGRGGWPMSVFLGHDRRPFYAGTYWPPHQRGGMPGFDQVLAAIADAWRQRRDEVEQHAGEITVALEQIAAGSDTAAAAMPGDELIARATERLLQAFDSRDGGFGEAPKFPHAMDLELLLRRGLGRGASSLIDAAEFTLDKMAAGGIRDHLGGGFARYSVDSQWLVPHFEKMLYDNALLGEVYLRAFQVTNHQRHAEVAAEVFDYLCREMVDPAGGLHCSEDADSEGEEGKYYVWTPEEIRELLGAERGERFCTIYDVTPGGNFEGHSILHLRRPLQEWAEESDMPVESFLRQLAADRETLRLARQQRVKPGRDDKIITAWNALAVRGLSIAGAVLNRADFIHAGRAAAEFIHGTLRREDGRLWHAYRDGTAHIDGFVDDYAYTIEAYLAVFEATGQPVWIARAAELADFLLAHFEDRQQGGFYYTPDDGEALITRNKDWHDGSLVSGNAAVVMSLTRLSHLLGRNDYHAAAERALQAGYDVLHRQAAACGALLIALDRHLHADEQLVCAVANDTQFLRARSLLMRRFRPHTTLSWVIGDGLHNGELVKLNCGKPPLAGEITLYRCRDYTCEQPLVAADALDYLRDNSP